MAENWQAYGFPNPTFRTAYKPFVGLCKATKERARASGTSGVQMDIPDWFAPQSPESAFSLCFHIDQAIIEMVNGFVNHEKYADLDADSELDDMLWNWEDLLLAGADGEESEIINLYANPPPRLLPEWSAKWAKQRYKMLNLLRYGTVPFEVEYIYGEAYQQHPKYAAYSTAFATARTVIQNEYPPYSMFSGYGDYYGNAEIAQTRKFYPVPPDGTNLTDFWAVGFVRPTDSETAFDPLGSGLSEGWNQIHAQNGYFLNTAQNYPYPAGWESVIAEGYNIGWTIFDGPEGNDAVLVYADFNPIFNFKEEEA